LSPLAPILAILQAVGMIRRCCEAIPALTLGNDGLRFEKLK
jgi:hypothetical protein